MEEISYAGAPSRRKKRVSRRLIVFGGIFILVLLLLGSAVYFITNDKSSDPSDSSLTNSPTVAEVTSTPIPTEEPSLTPEKSEAPSTSPSKSITKTPSKSISPSPSGVSANTDLKVAVQNGSGVTGAAAKAADTLKAAGYTISSTGNADNNDYTDVTIQIKNSEKSSLSGLEKVMAKEYTVSNTSADLPESSSYDVLIIIGK